MRRVPEGLQIGGRRGLEVAVPLAQPAQHVVGVGQRRIQPERLLEAVAGLLDALRLEQAHALGEERPGARL